VTLTCGAESLDDTMLELLMAGWTVDVQLLTFPTLEIAIRIKDLHLHSPLARLLGFR
jgi:hypothetical protein